MGLLSAERLRALSPAQREEVERLTREIEAIKRQDPLQAFHSCVTDCGLPGCRPHPKQHAFLCAQTKTQAAFAGNRSGKSVALVVKCFVQHYPSDTLPERLRPYKVVSHERPVKGRLMCPSEKALQGYILPKLREYAPRQLLVGGAFDKAWQKQHNVLLFKDGGLLEVMTYQMDADKLVGSDLDYVAYDEPPPEAHRNENYPRLLDRKGFEMFAMTPVNMVGGGIGWVFDQIEMRRESEDVSVHRWSIHDNPWLDPQEIEKTLSIYSEDERRAREFGEFIHFGGMVYRSGLEGVLVDPPSAKHVQGLDVVIGIDPGLKNAAFIWVGFDSDNVALVFHEELLQEKTPEDYVRLIRRVNSAFGVCRETYVIDPSARNRSLVNARDVQSELQNLGLHPIPGQNAVEAGVQHIRRRLEGGHLLVSKDCRGLRDEARRYRMQDRADGEFAVVKENDHRLDALRYAIQSRPWHPWGEMAGPRRKLGFDPTSGHVGPWSGDLTPQPESPLGPWS